MVIFDRCSMRTLLAACLMLGAFSACGGDDGGSESGGDDGMGGDDGSGGDDGMGGDDGSGGMMVAEEGATFAEVNQEVIAPTCGLVSCHGDFVSEEDDLPAAGLDLVTDPYNALVGQSSTAVTDAMFVVPSDPDGSYLMEKLTDDPPRAGTIMPQKTAALAPEYIEIVRSWIAAGALNN